MNKTKIEWTETTWNPITGCTKRSAGCINCYAERMAKRLQAMGAEAYQFGFTPMFHEHLLEKPLSWKRSRMIFVNSMSDTFHENITDSQILKLFSVMNKARWHTFQVLEVFTPAWMVEAMLDLVKSETERMDSRLQALIMRGVFKKEKLPKRSLDDIKSVARILFIDDHKFRLIDILKAGGWHNVQWVKDVESLSITELSDSHIILVDIQGVGKKMQFHDEGLCLTIALKVEAIAKLTQGYL
jgi:protein gp37